MAIVEVTLKLPEDLVKEAQEFDLLTPEAIAVLLRSEVDRRVMDFVNTEIKTYRAEKSANKKQELI